MANLKELLAQNGLMGNSENITTNVSNGAITPVKLATITDLVTLDQAGAGNTLRVIKPTVLMVSGGYQGTILIGDTGFFLWEGTSNTKLYGTGLVTVRPIACTPAAVVLPSPRVLQGRVWVKGDVTAALTINLFKSGNDQPVAHVTVPVADYSGSPQVFEFIEEGGSTAFPWVLGDTDAIFMSINTGGAISGGFLLWQVYIG